MSDDILSYWLDEKNRTVNGSLYYWNGFMKAAFGSFIEGLDVIYCNDLCVDIADEIILVFWDNFSIPNGCAAYRIQNL